MNKQTLILLASMLLLGIVMGIIFSYIYLTDAIMLLSALIIGLVVSFIIREDLGKKEITATASYVGAIVSCASAWVTLNVVLFFTNN